ncbi:hypothetical protein PENTCL1PPCAC_9857, partial [Pristionchus entomophagus]
AQNLPYDCCVFLGIMMSYCSLQLVIRLAHLQLDNSEKKIATPPINYPRIMIGGLTLTACLMIVSFVCLEYSLIHSSPTVALVLVAQSFLFLIGTHLVGRLTQKLGESFCWISSLLFLVVSVFLAFLATDTRAFRASLCFCLMTCIYFVLLGGALIIIDTIKKDAARTAANTAAAAAAVAP